MIEMQNLISQLKSHWSIPRKTIHNNEETFLELICEFSDEIAHIPKEYPYEIPQDLKNFWHSTKEAGLFIDNTYGQWGLRILSPQDALLNTKEQREIRENEYKSSELIIGNFMGDSDKLVIDTGSENFGRVTIALPIDSREHWPIVSDSFTNFLIAYIEKNGYKFWENS